MSRNKLYKVRMDICITPEQRKLVKEMAKKYNKTMNEIIREAIVQKWEKV